MNHVLRTNTLSATLKWVAKNAVEVNVEGPVNSAILTFMDDHGCPNVRTWEILTTYQIGDKIIIDIQSTQS